MGTLWHRRSARSSAAASARSGPRFWTAAWPSAGSTASTTPGTAICAATARCRMPASASASSAPSPTHRPRQRARRHPLPENAGECQVLMRQVSSLRRKPGESQHDNRAACLASRRAFAKLTHARKNPTSQLSWFC